MSHLLYWPTVTHFYPVGNTSAVCLTENLSPESNADVLLLACGDPRHILYTFYVNETNSSAHSRVLDVTCCDVDPAVIARNTLLFTLLADKRVPDELDNLWGLFYHMFVGKRTLDMLFEQCRKLIPLAESMERWRAGPYGHFITVCDAATLSQLRRIWTMYLDIASLSPHQAKKFEERFRDGMKEMQRKGDQGTTAAPRSAGPLMYDVTMTVADQFKSYWSSGTTDDAPQGRKKPLTVNPTFAFSVDGDKFSVDYGTDPLCGFHLAEAFASGRFGPPHEHIAPRDVVSIAKDQFSRWCTSMSRVLKETNPTSRTFVLRMFAGDALSFCQALKYCGEKRSPVTPYTVGAWQLSTIILDDHCYGRNASSPAPLSFNIIDTSNILDFVGLLNLLVVTVPLLSGTPSATLYTEAILRTSNVKNRSQAILDHLCGDLPTMALLLGIIPSTFISQFATRSNVHEILAMGPASQQYHERLAWKAIKPQRACFSPNELAAFLLRVHVQMFSDEDMESISRDLSLPPEELAQKLSLSSVLHYNRRSFALLVRLVKTRVHTDWQRTIDLFGDMVKEDERLHLGKPSFQELCCQLHLLGVYSAQWPSMREFLNADNTNGRLFALFHGWTWKRIPAIVTLTLVVPRDAIARLEPDFEDVGTPALQCDIRDGMREIFFTATTATFGTLHVSGTGEHRTGIIVQGEAEVGVSPSTRTYLPGILPPWRTGAPMIITFAIPACVAIYLSQNSSATIGLVLRSSMALLSKFSKKSGRDLTVFRTSLFDRERVFVLARPPVAGTRTDTGTVTSIGPVVDYHLQDNAGGDLTVPGGTSADVHVKMNSDRSTILTFTVRVEVTDPHARAVLADPQTDPTVSSGSSASGTRCFYAYVSIGTHVFPIHFPLPVDITRAELRVTRKASYVEVVAPPASFDVQPERDLLVRSSSLSLASNNDGTPTLGCIHRINLDRCPTFKPPKQTSKVNWFQMHVLFMFSEFMRFGERAGQAESPWTVGLSGFPTLPQHPRDTLVKLKSSLKPLLLSAAGTNPDSPGPEDVFVLFDTERKVEYMFIIVAHMRLDVGSHTVVADAFVVKASPVMRTMLDTAMSAKSNKGDGPRRLGSGALGMLLKTDKDETEAWFHFISRLAERCRTWSHKETCEYRQGTSKQDAQRSDRLWETRGPLCTCGLGVGTEILPEHFQPLAPYLTRAAISPLFSVLYLKEAGIPVDGPTKAAEEPMNASQVAMPPKQEQNQDGGQMDAIENCCRSCRKEGGLKCSRCKRVRYCSQACQRADWKAHKKDCTER